MIVLTVYATVLDKDAVQCVALSVAVEDSRLLPHTVKLKHINCKTKV